MVQEQVHWFQADQTSDPPPSQTGAQKTIVIRRGPALSGGFHEEAAPGVPHSQWTIVDQAGKPVMTTLTQLDGSSPLAQPT